MQHQLQKSNRFKIEKLEDRIAPSSGNFPPGQFPSGNPFIGGVFRVDPSGAADGHSMLHRFPETGVAGLNTAEAVSGVVRWTPT